MNVGVLGNRDSWYVADIERACRARGHRARRLEFRTLLAADGMASAGFPVEASEPEGRSPLDALDAVIVRTMPPGSLEQVVFRMDVLARLETVGVAVVNPPRAIECAVDKYLATARLAAAGLPVPETIVCQDADSAMAAYQALGGDVVVKPLFGAEGRGIVRVSDPDLAFRTFRTLERIQAVLYLQRFVEHEGYDVRVLVLGGLVLGGFKRRSPHDFRTNMARSAIGESHELTDDERQMALSAVQVTGALFGGVDLLYDRGGRCFVLEVNAVPGWQAFRRVTGVDVADRLIEWLERRLAAAH